MSRGWRGLVLMASLCAFAACEATPAAAPTPSARGPRDLDPAAAEGSFAPGLSVGPEEALMTWWERLEAPEGERRNRLMFARFTDGWTEPTVVADDLDFFANWADFPSAIREPRGSILTFWLEKTDSATFSYSIILARSEDDGASWRRLGRLNDDETDTEHGFVSMVVDGDAVRAFWLDGRLMADEGPMTVRTARIGDSIEPSEVLDERVCECCPTDAVVGDSGPIVVFRDRGEDELREIHAVVAGPETRGPSVAVTADGWRIPGCPVNGPAIGYANGRTALAWFTGGDSRPRVSAAFGDGSGGNFGAPLVIDETMPLGRVGLVMDGADEAVVSWLAVAGDEAELRLRRVSADGRLGEPLNIARTSAARASGMPQLERFGDNLLIAWVEILDGEPSRVRMRTIPVGEVPEVG